MPPPTNHWRGTVIVYLLFTEEKPLYFLLINNWHVWVGWGTKSHSNVHGYRADCVFVLCARADNRLSSPHGSLSSPRGFFVWAELRVINGNTLSYLVLRSVQLEKVELTTSYIHSNLILQTVGISHIRWDPMTMNNFSSWVKEYPIKIGFIVYVFLPDDIKRGCRGRGGFVRHLLQLSNFSQLIPNPQTVQLSVDKPSLFHYQEHLTCCVDT